MLLGWLPFAVGTFSWYWLTPEFPGGAIVTLAATALAGRASDTSSPISARLIDSTLRSRRAQADTLLGTGLFAPSSHHHRSDINTGWPMMRTGTTVADATNGWASCEGVGLDPGLHAGDATARLRAGCRTTKLDQGRKDVGARSFDALEASLSEAPPSRPAHRDRASRPLRHPSGRRAVERPRPNRAPDRGPADQPWRAPSRRGGTGPRPDSSSPSSEGSRSQRSRSATHSNSPGTHSRRPVARDDQDLSTIRHGELVLISVGTSPSAKIASLRAVVHVGQPADRLARRPLITRMRTDRRDRGLRVRLVGEEGRGVPAISGWSTTRAWTLPDRLGERNAPPDP